MKLRIFLEVVVLTILGSAFFLLLLLPAQITIFASINMFFGRIVMFVATILVILSLLGFGGLVDISDEVLKWLLGNDFGITLLITFAPNNNQIQLSIIARLLFGLSIFVGLFAIIIKKEYKSLRLRHALALLCVSYSIYALTVFAQTWFIPNVP